MDRKPTKKSTFKFGGFHNPVPIKATTTVTSWADIPIEPEHKEVRAIIRSISSVFQTKLEAQVEKVVWGPQADPIQLDLNNLIMMSVSREVLKETYSQLRSTLPSWTTARTEFMKYPHWFSKNHCAFQVPENHIFNHLFLALGVAFKLSQSYTILDVDSLFNPMLPSASDITLYDQEVGLIFIDVTATTVLDGKIPNLINSISRISFDVPINAYAVALSLEPIDKVEPLVNLPTERKVSWGSDPEALTSKLFPLFQAASVTQLEKLKKVLAGIIEPCLEEIVPVTTNNTNSVDTLHDTANEFIRISSIHLGLDEESTLTYLHHLSTGKVQGISTFYKELRKSNLSFFRNDSFMKVGFEEIKARSELKRLSIAPPITYLNDFFEDMDNLHSMDATLWAFKQARSLSDKWAPGKPTKFVFMSGGKIEPMDAKTKMAVDFDVRQSIQHPFPDHVVAYVNLPTFFKLTYMNGSSIISLLEYNKLSETYPVDASPLSVKEEEMTTSYFQILLNPLYQPDENFSDFLSRGNKSHKAGKYEKWKSLAECDDVNEQDFMSFSKSLLPSPNEVLMQSVSLRSSRRKTELIMKTKSAPAIAQQSQCMSGRTSSLLINLMDSLSSQAKAYSTFLNIKHEENAAVFLESPDHAFFGLWYLPGTWPSFKTTWRKFYSVTEVMDLKHYNLGPLMGSLGSQEYNHDRIGVLSQVAKNLVEVSSEIDPDSILQAARMGNLANKELTLKKRKLLLVTSKFHSVDRMHLEWELECVNKALCRVASLCEYRVSLYSHLSDPVIPKDVASDLDEINMNLMSFMQNRQQFSVISTAWRYLHQALGSLDFDPKAIIAKISECTIKSRYEALYLTRMVAIYKIALMLRVKKGINHIRSNNREVFVSAPDMLFASNLASLNVSTYSTSNMLNTQKQWRVSSEASCVLAAWEQNDNLDQVMMTNKDLWYGMERSLFFKLLDYQYRDIDDFTNLVEVNAGSIARFTQLLISHTKAYNYCTNFFFEMLVHVALRLDKGTFSALESLGGKGIKEFLTMKGSTTCTELKSYDSNPAMRKATAFIIMLARLLKDNASIKDADSIIEASEGHLMDNVDQFELAKLLLTSKYVESVQPISQFSEKDAPGKDREISTLNVEFGALCLLCEKVAQPYSASIPEDLVTHSSKEWSIYKSVLNLERMREEDDKVDVLYINQDKSKYGPNRKVNSMLLSACILSSDPTTYSLFEVALNMSSRKLICYPHEIVRESLKLEKDLLKGILERRNASRVVGMTGDLLPIMHGKTAAVMRDIFDQYSEGNTRGKAGSTWVHVREGMPGQGIFTTISSISHAAAQRYYSNYINRRLGWYWQSRVTSDDSLTMIVHPKKENLLMHNGIKTLVSKLNYQMGLIENLGKMTVTARKPEMNTFYMLRGEPICAIWKFLGAFCSIQTSGNLGEDLLQCVAKGADLFRLGGSAFISSYLVSTLMAMMLDAYRMWSPYLKLQETVTANPLVDSLWSGPVEIFGIPSIDPISSVLSPIGPRVSSARVSGLSEEEAMRYTDMILESSLMASRIDQEMKMKDKAGNVIEDNFIRYTTKEGEYVTSLKKMPPTVNGLIGALYRRKHDIKVAKELGKLAVRFQEKTQFKGWTLLSLLEHINSSFEHPMKHGHSARDVLTQYTEVAHSINHPFLKVSPNSFLPDEVVGKVISLSTLRTNLSDADFVLRMSNKFKARLSVSIEFPENIAGLSSYLKKQARDVVSLSDFLWSSQIVANFVSSENEEFLQECGLGRLAFKRLIKLNVDVNQQDIIPFNGIRKELLERYLEPNILVTTELNSLKLKAYGELGEYEALAQVELTLERLKTMIPKPLVLYSETRAGYHNRDAELGDWLTMNPFHNHQLRMTSMEIGHVIENMATRPASLLEEASTTSDDAYKSLRYGLVKSMGKTKLSWDGSIPGVRKALPNEDSKLELGFKVSDQDWARIYAGGSDFYMSSQTALLICERMIKNFWYGSSHLRIKIDAFTQIRVRNEMFVVFATTTKSHYSKMYEHQLTFYASNQASINDIDPGGFEILDKVFSRFGFSSPYPTSSWTVGQDYYEIRVLNPKQPRSLGLLLLDYVILGGDGKLLLPTCAMHAVAPIGQEGSILVDELKYVPKASHVNPEGNSLPKVPIYSMSLDSQKAWFATLKDLSDKLESQNSRGPALISMVDLMASFLVSGDSSSLKDTNVEEVEREVLRGTVDMNEKIRRFSNFSLFARKLPLNSMYLAVSIYDHWASTIAVFVKSANQGPRLEALGYKEQRASGLECRLIDTIEYSSKSVTEYHQEQNSRLKDIMDLMLEGSREAHVEPLADITTPDKEEVKEISEEPIIASALSMDPDSVDDLSDEMLMKMLLATAPASGTAEIWLDGMKLE